MGHRRMTTSWPACSTRPNPTVGVYVEQNPAAPTGDGATGALERVCRLSQGEPAGGLRQCLADARAGANLPGALQWLADRTGLASLARFVDGIVVAANVST